jgi:hypothetical protein
MAPASFPEIESPNLRKSGVVWGSEELRSSAIGQTSRDVGRASNLLNDNSSLIVIGGQKTLHFGKGTPCLPKLLAEGKVAANEGLRRWPVE